MQIIERSLPKRQKVKKDPSEVEREEREKIGKYWVNMVRKDIPKHYRIFTNFHKKQLIDAKRLSEICIREVKLPDHLFLIFFFFFSHTVINASLRWLSKFSFYIFTTNYYRHSDSWSFSLFSR